MPITSMNEIVVSMLSELRHGAERCQPIYQELAQAIQSPQIKEALKSRGMIASQVLSRLDECFKLINEKPVKVNQRLRDVFIEDFRKELNEIQQPLARKLFVLAKANHLAHLEIAAYVALIEAADTQGHPGVAILLESCLADELAFAGRAKRLIRQHLEQKVSAA
jgi:ferritin-like metal-binding protein YciE